MTSQEKLVRSLVERVGGQGDDAGVVDVVSVVLDVLVGWLVEEQFCVSEVLARKEVLRLAGERFSG